MDDANTWPEMIDRAILSDFAEQGPDYAALVASRRGLHLGTVRDRCACLEENGDLERVSEEVLYRVTAQGEARLAASPDDPDQAAPGADE